MKFRTWISGKELMERWQVKPLDLIDIVLDEKLSVYEPDGRLAEYEGEDAIRANHPGPYPPPPPKDDPSIYDLIFNPLSYNYKIPPIEAPSGYIPLANRIEQYLFKLNDVEGFEKKHNLILQDIQPRENDKEGYGQVIKELIRKEVTEFCQINPDITIQDMAPKDEINAIVKKQAETSSLEKEVKQKKERKKTKLQICREKVREKASEIWSKDPSITIADMAVSDEITKIVMEQCGKLLTEDTLRRWINDLSPDRSPGRRPNPNKKSKRSPKKSQG